MQPWGPPCWMLRASIWIYRLRALKNIGIFGHCILIMFVSSLQNAYCSVTLFLAFFLTFKRVTNIDLAYTSGSLVFMLMEI